AQINGVDAMRLKNTDGRRPYEPAVAVVLDVRSVMQHVNAEFLRIPAPEKVLHVQVGNSNLLAAPLEVRIESAVGFLFAAIENRDVVLIAVGCLVAEEPDSKIRVGENEAAEVAAERLRAGPYRQEVEVGREVAQLALIKKLLDREVGIVASRAAPHIRLHDCVFRDALVVVVRDQRNLQPLPDRLECSVSLEEIRRNDERLKDRALLVLSEEMNALRLVRAHAGRRWQRARFEQSVGHARERKERVRASERKVALIEILIVGIQLSARVLVELIRRRRNAPAIGHCEEVLAQIGKRSIDDGRLDRPLALQKTGQLDP